MKNQALFSSKDKSKKLKCCLLQFLFGPLRVKNPSTVFTTHISEFSGSDSEGNSADPDQTAPKESDQSLHCLPTTFRNTTQ